MAEARKQGPVRARLVDVAAAAGTSKPIASRILNDDPTLSVTPQLRERVRHAAAELRYRPHAGARSLRLAEAGAVGMLMPSFLNPAHTLIVRGAFRRALERDSTVLLAEDADEAHVDETFARLVAAGRIDGLIVGTARPGATLPGLLASRTVPHVFVNRGVAGSGRNVVMDEECAARLAVEHLVSLGHRRIAHVAGPLDIDPVARRVAGFRAAIEELVGGRPLVVEAALLETGGADGLALVLAADEQVTAIVTSTVSQAVGLLQAAWQAGIEVPGELSVVATGDMPLAAMLVPSLTAVSMPYAELGAAALDALLEQLETGRVEDRLVATRPRLIERGSTATPRCDADQAPRLATIGG